MEHDIKIKEVKEFKNIEGRGVSAKILEDTFFIGNYELIKDLKLDSEKLELEIDSYHNQGKKSLICVKNNIVVGIVLIKDKIKESSFKAMKLFKERNIETIMLTGDNKLIADSIANETQIDKVYADVLPQEKKEILKSIKRDKEHLVAMVGDGVNDALALMDSDLGISLGGGSDIAKDSSDIVLLRNDLCDIVNIIDLSKFVLSTIKLNLFWAFFYNSIGIVLASGVLYYALGIKLNPMIGSLTMSISSVFVVLNALRINMFKGNNLINRKEDEGMDVTIIKVEGMMCNRCKAHVEKAVLKTEGVEYCEVSLENNNVTVKVKDNKVIDQIIKNIIEEGYDASL